MISVLTGDIIHSGQMKASVWMKVLKKFLNSKGESPKQWEIFRGDEFQLEIPRIEDALVSAIQLKAAIRSISGLDVRISIGIGKKEYNAARITQCNGSAFVHSGRRFEELRKEKVTLAVRSGNDAFDEEINLMIRLALTIMDNWSATSAETVHQLIHHKNKSQGELAALLNINQSAISQRVKRAQFDLLMELNRYYVNRVKKLG